jgi:hypothetical protein
MLDVYFQKMTADIEQACLHPSTALPVSALPLLTMLVNTYLITGDAFGEPDVSSSGTPTVSIADSDGDMLNELSEADSDCRKILIHLVSAPKLSQDVSRSYAIS